MKHITIRKTGMITLLAMFLTFAGCSSDNSSETSSGGGGDDTPAVTLAGTYTGTATATASALGLTESETVPVTVIIDSNGNVTIQSGSDLFPNVFTLSGNTFAISQTFTDQQFGSATCSGTLNLQGSIDNSGKLTATLTSQNVSCNGIPGTVTGSLVATKQ